MRERSGFLWAALVAAAWVASPACGGSEFKSGGDTTDGGPSADGAPSDGAPVDAPQADAAEAGPSICADAAAFTMFDKGCSSSLACAIGMHQIDCCGSKLAIGINHSQVSAFQAAESSWEAACPATCGCPAVIRTEDGKTATPSTIKVACDNGMCTTTAQ